MQRHLLLLCLGLVLVLTGCGQKSSTIKIGLAGVQTGPDGEIGRAMLEGSQIAIDEWNAKGGVLGKQLEAVSRDDEGRPEKAVTVAQEMVSQGVAAVIGHFNSGCTIPASSIYAQNNVLQITPGSTNPKATEQGFKTLFRVCGRDDQQGVVAGDFLRDKLKLDKIAVLHDKTAYGQGLAEVVRDTFTKKGGQVVIFTGIAKEELDFRANISTLKSAGAQAVFWGGMYSQGAPLVIQMRQAGLNIPLVGGDGIIDQSFINTAGANTANVFMTFGPDYKQIPTAQPFLEKYRAKYGPEGAYSVYGYDAVNIYLTAVQQAGTTDAAAVAQAMHTHTYQTSLGPVEFDDKGDLKKTNYVIWTIQDGKFVVLQ